MASGLHLEAQAGLEALTSLLAILSLECPQLHALPLLTLPSAEKPLRPPRQSTWAFRAQRAELSRLLRFPWELLW